MTEQPDWQRLKQIIITFLKYIVGAPEIARSAELFKDLQGIQGNK